MTVETVLPYLRRDALPLPALENREGYGATDDARYWLFGLDDYLRLMTAVDARSVKHGRFLDIGCASGRVTRHVFVQSDFSEVYGCDFKTMHVAWCKANLPAEMRIILNHALPHLPFPDHHFDVVSAFSVFTHIDAFEDAWLLEIARILRPGGLLYLTFQGDASWANIPKHLKERLMVTPEGQDVDFEAPIMPLDRLRFTVSQNSHYAATLFHKDAYVRRFWGRFVAIEEIVPLGHVHQNVLIARARA